MNNHQLTSDNKPKIFFTTDSKLHNSNARGFVCQSVQYYNFVTKTAKCTLANKEKVIEYTSFTGV